MGEAPVRFETIRIPDEETGLASIGQGAFPQGYLWDSLTISQVFRTETRGKKLLVTFDRLLTPLRNRIAHALLDSGELADLDDPTLLRDIEEWLPFARFAARIAVLTDMRVDLPAQVSEEFERRLAAKDK